MPRAEHAASIDAATGGNILTVYERRVFFPTDSSVSAARHWAAMHLAERYAPGLVEDALLCVSELAANAVHHAGTAYEVRLLDRDGRLHISVVDEDQSIDPFAKPATLPETFAETGRGLAIVAAVSAVHGTTMEGGRKLVWCELHPL